MPEINKANRQVCDVEFRVLKTKKPYMLFDTANTTTMGVEGESVFAMAKGSRRISFENAPTGTMTIEAQVIPFKVFALFANGDVETKAVYAVHKKITCATAGSLTIGSDAVAGTLFVYPEGEYGDESALIAGTLADGTFTATTAADIAKDAVFEVGYLVKKESGVKKVSINMKNVPKDYYVTMNTVDKDEDGLLTPFVITAYKAHVQRNFELSFSSEGDPASITITLDLLEDKDGNMIDMVELTDEAA